MQFLFYCFFGQSYTILRLHGALDSASKNTSASPTILKNLLPNYNTTMRYVNRKPNPQYKQVAHTDIVSEIMYIFILFVFEKLKFRTLKSWISQLH